MTPVWQAGPPPNSLKDLVPYIKANKEKISFAMPESARLPPVRAHVHERDRNRMVTVPYKGTAPAMNDRSAARSTCLCDQTTQRRPTSRRHA